MTRFVKIFVVDDQGRGVSGQRVKTYGSAEQRTDRSGAVTLAMDGSDVSLYVNGFTAFRGPPSRLGAQAAFSTDGRRL